MQLSEMMTAKLNEQSGESATPDDELVDKATEPEATDEAPKTEEPPKEEEQPKESVGIESIRTQLESLDKDTKPLRDLAKEVGGIDGLRQASNLFQLLKQGDDDAVIDVLREIHEFSPTVYDKIVDAIGAAYFTPEEQATQAPAKPAVTEEDDDLDDDPVAAENARLKQENQQLTNKLKENENLSTTQVIEARQNEFVDDIINHAWTEFGKSGLADNKIISEHIALKLQTTLPTIKEVTQAMSAHVNQDGKRAESLRVAAYDRINNLIAETLAEIGPAVVKQQPKPEPTKAPTPPVVEGQPAPQTAVVVPQMKPGSNVSMADIALARLNAAKAQGVRFE